MIYKEIRKKTHHFLRKRIDAGEFALSNNNSLKMIDLVVKKLSLRI